MATTQNKTSFLIDVRQTKEYTSFMQKIGWQVEKIDGIYIFIKKLPLIPFSIAKILRSKKLIQLSKLKPLIKKHRIIFIKINPFILDKEKIPRYFILNTKYSPDKSPTIPTKTIWLDLLKSENQLLTEMKAKTRYNIGLTQKKNLKIKVVAGNQITDDQLKDFYYLWQKNKPFNWLFKPSFNELKYLVESFGNKCFFVIVELCHSDPAAAREESNEVPLSGTKRKLRRFAPRSFALLRMTEQLVASCLILTSNRMSFYWHNYSSKEGKKLMAPTLCVWQAILKSKKRKLQIFDLEGIWDQRFPKLNQGWQGFSKFKQGFGGKEIEFISPLRY